MPKHYGAVGFAEVIESPAGSGIWIESIVEQHYYIDLVKNTTHTDSASQVNNNIQIRNSFSFVRDAYAQANFHSIRYVEFNGVKWKVDSVDASTPPRLVLAASTVYTEETPAQ